MDLRGRQTIGVIRRAIPITTGALLDNRYDLHAAIGQGGMGQIFKAMDRRTGAACAVKVLRSDLIAQQMPSLPAADRVQVLEESRERFLREARATAQLSHPNIVRVTDVGEVNGVFYYVMELLEGESLNGLLERVGRLDPLELLKTMRHVVQALVYAHEKGVLHRDLKPENIFLARVAGEVLPKIIDLGLAKIRGDELSVQASGGTREATILGTPEYMAPEQWRDARSATERCDIYSLGFVMMEALTGVKIEFSSTLEYYQWHASGDREALFGPRLARVPQSLRSLVFDCMQIEPEKRPASMNVLLARIEALIEDLVAPMPVTMSVPSPSPSRGTRLYLFAGVPAMTLALLGAMLWRNRGHGASSERPVERAPVTFVAHQGPAQEVRLLPLAPVAESPIRPVAAPSSAPVAVTQSQAPVRRARPRRVPTSQFCRNGIGLLVPCLRP